MKNNWKDNVCFILVEPVESGNIGAAARAIKNMGFRRLRVVGGPEVLGEQAEWFAHGSMDVLENMQQFPTFESAVADISLVVATSRRKGKRRGAIVNPDEGALRMVEVAQNNTVAIAFGAERTGLCNEDVDRCGFLINIPADTDQPSLNLGQAVMVMAYELAMVPLRRDDVLPEAAEANLAIQEDQEVVYENLMQVVELIGFSKEGRRTIGRNMRVPLRRFLGNARLTADEMSILKGISVRLIIELTKANKE